MLLRDYPPYKEWFERERPPADPQEYEEFTSLFEVGTLLLPDIIFDVEKFEALLVSRHQYDPETPLIDFIHAKWGYWAVNILKNVLITLGAILTMLEVEMLSKQLTASILEGVKEQVEQQGVKKTYEV